MLPDGILPKLRTYAGHLFGEPGAAGVATSVSAGGTEGVGGVRDVPTQPVVLDRRGRLCPAVAGPAVTWWRAELGREVTRGLLNEAADARCRRLVKGGLDLPLLFEEVAELLADRRHPDIGG